MSDGVAAFSADYGVSSETRYCVHTAGLSAEVMSVNLTADYYSYLVSSRSFHSDSIFFIVVDVLTFFAVFISVFLCYVCLFICLAFTAETIW